MAEGLKAAGFGDYRAGTMRNCCEVGRDSISAEKLKLSARPRRKDYSHLMPLRGHIATSAHEHHSYLSRNHRTVGVLHGGDR